MFDGMLRRLGHHVPRERIRQSLVRVDPVQRVFQRITIRRRTYYVPALILSGIMTASMGSSAG
ncbi:hypothetical protein K438DRAFT_1032782 [Mycena galopus ATCC 62051]|nr:hypothetical protein K438DRAFT_1032782 [Mycena galopus ATCC 62051]